MERKLATIRRIDKLVELVVKECSNNCVYEIDRQEILAHFGIE